MPLYEFDCSDCGEPFEELVRSADAAKDVTCPSCGSPKVRKKLSTFAARVAGSGSTLGASPASCAPGGL